MIKGICGYEENTAFVWSNYSKNKKMPKFTEDMIVVINDGRDIMIYDVSGLNKNEERNLVVRHCRYFSDGCNYKYEIAQHIGNVYFCNSEARK